MVFLLISFDFCSAGGIVTVAAILINIVCLYVLVSPVNHERVGLDVGYVKKVPDEFPTG